ncbi:MAG: CBS domain-containing protein, partial [Gemmatimonadota bacterium]
HEWWPVVDDGGLVGMVRRSAVRTAIAAETGSSLPDLVVRAGTEQEQGAGPPHVHPDHTLSLALSRMGASNASVLPVVSRANVRRLLGILALDDVLGTYGLRGDGEAPKR